MAIHRKHHAKCETVKMIPTARSSKACPPFCAKAPSCTAPKRENPEDPAHLRQNCPEDSDRAQPLFPLSAAGRGDHGRYIDLPPFGTIGITIWAIQMMWIPGVGCRRGQSSGSRRRLPQLRVPRCSDQSGALGHSSIGGEELHNNHHTYPNSAKLSVKKWEFDMGWAWIKLFSLLGLAKVQRVAPIAHRVEGKGSLDMDTAMAILNNRFQIMAQYRKLV